LAHRTSFRVGETISPCYDFVQRKSVPTSDKQGPHKGAKMAKKKSAKAMKTYLVTYHSPASAMKKMAKATPDEMAAGMNEWMKWAKKCGKQLVEMGAPLTGSVNLKATGGAVPSKRKITGYSILQAESMAAAKKLLKGHPHLAWIKGCEIEVHEAMPMG
jgi:hypothetical protein